MTSITVPKKHADTWTDIWGTTHDVVDGYPTEEGYVPRFSKVDQKVVAKYKLIPWAAQVERDRIVDILALGPKSWAQVRAELIERNGAYKSTGEPKLTHEIVRDAAGATGTAAHAWMRTPYEPRPCPASATAGHPNDPHRVDGG